MPAGSYNRIRKKKHPTEKKAPVQSEAFRQFLDEAWETYLNKNADYSSANIVYTGEIGVLIRVWDKFCRLMNLNGVDFPVDTIKNPSINWSNIHPKTPKNESIEDAWKDLAVYAIIGLLQHQKKWGR